MSADASLPAHCRNCGQRLNPWDRFCSQCGQETADHPPGFWEFVHEWVLHYVAVEGKLWKSLWALLTRPGFLTQEYLAGRKLRYVLPLRLLLSFGLLFFVVLKFSATPDVKWSTVPLDLNRPLVNVSVDRGTAPQASPGTAATNRPQAGTERAERHRAPAPNTLQVTEKEMASLPAFLREPVQRAAKRLAANRDAFLAQLKGTLLSLAPYAVLLSLPIFAGMLKLLFPRTVYGAHFVFAVHLHAAWYLMLLLVLLLGSYGWALFLIWLWSNLYPLLALKRVSGAGWRSTLLRSILLALMHWVALYGLLIALFLIGLGSA